MCICLPCVVFLPLSEQTLQSHGEYLKEQIGAYQGKARKIARGVFWLDHMLVNTIHSCAVIRCGTVAMLDGVLVTVWVEALRVWEEGSDFPMYTLAMATEPLQFSERYIDAPEEITMDERK